MRTGICYAMSYEGNFAWSAALRTTLILNSNCQRLFHMHAMCTQDLGFCYHLNNYILSFARIHVLHQMKFLGQRRDQTQDVHVNEPTSYSLSHCGTPLYITSFPLPKGKKNEMKWGLTSYCSSLIGLMKTGICHTVCYEGNFARAESLWPTLISNSNCQGTSFFVPSEQLDSYPFQQKKTTKKI